jgi:hypothetical protein
MQSVCGAGDVVQMFAVMPLPNLEQLACPDEESAA